MNELVYVEGNRVLTDSLRVARVFDKGHDKVLRDIRTLGCSAEFRLANFGESSYRNEQGREMPCYQLTEQGLMLLAMGYTGPFAMGIKERYIAAFEAMKRELETRHAPRPLSRLELIDLAREAEVARLDAEAKAEALSAQLTLQAPKLALYEVAMHATNAQSVGVVAKALGLGQNRLFAWLRDEKILISQGAKKNLPMQDYLDRGYFTVREYSITHLTSGIQNKAQTLVTPKGMAWIHARWQAQHGSPAVLAPQHGRDEA